MYIPDDKAAAYKELVNRFGEEAVADAILAKWLADSEAMGSWMRLAAACGLDVPERERHDVPAHRRVHRLRNTPYVIQTRSSLGRREVA